jgi:hypothetical protein
MRKDDIISSDELIDIGEKLAKGVARTSSVFLRNILKILDEKENQHENKDNKK